MPGLDTARQGAPRDSERLPDDQAPVRGGLARDGERAGGGGLSPGTGLKRAEIEIEKVNFPARVYTTISANFGGKTLPRLNSILAKIEIGIEFSATPTLENSILAKIEIQSRGPF